MRRDGGGIRAAGAVGRNAAHERSREQKFAPAVEEHIHRFAGAAQMAAFHQRGAVIFALDLPGRVAQVQIYAMWTGQPLKKMPPNIVERTSSNNGQDRGTEAKFPKYDPPPAIRHFEALKRMLDRKEPDYKD